MVIFQRILLLTSLFFSLLNQSFANDFSVYLDKNEYYLGEEINLFIETNGSKKYEIDLSPIEQKYRISAKRKLSNTNIVNGAVESTNTIIITLDILQAGSYEIPKLIAKTKNSQLESSKLYFKINQQRKAQDPRYSNLFSSNFKLSDDQIYAGEHIILTIILSRKQTNIADEAYNPPTSDDFIIEKLGNPKSYDKIIKNEKVTFIEINYLLIPLATGKLNIDLGSYEVAVPKYQNHNRDPFAHMFSLQMSDNFKKLSFPVKETPLVIEVKKSKYAENLPVLNMVKMSSKLNKNKGRIGEPLEYVINLNAHNIKAENLPEITLESEDFKIYPEAEIINNNFDSDKLDFIAEKSRKFILIPNKSGALTLPNYKFSWFDKKSQKKKSTTSPNKIAHITNKIIPAEIKTEDADLPQKTANSKVITEQNTPKIDQTILLIMLLILIGQTGYIIYMHKKKQTPPATTQKQTKTTAKKEPTKITNYTCLNQAICTLAQQQYGLNISSLSELRHLLEDQDEKLELTLLIKLLKQVENGEFSQQKSAKNYQKLYEDISKEMKNIPAQNKNNSFAKFTLNP